MKFSLLIRTLSCVSAGSTSSSSLIAFLISKQRFVSVELGKYELGLYEWSNFSLRRWIISAFFYLRRVTANFSRLRKQAFGSINSVLIILNYKI